MNTRSKFHGRKLEEEHKAYRRGELAYKDFGYRDLLAAEDEFGWLDKRPYCANCGKVKGSLAKSRYYPTRPCSCCGSSHTILRDFDGNEISWDKWVDLQDEQIRKTMSSPDLEAYSE